MKLEEDFLDCAFSVPIPWISFYHRAQAHFWRTIIYIFIAEKVSDPKIGASKLVRFAWCLFALYKLWTATKTNMNHFDVDEIVILYLNLHRCIILKVTWLSVFTKDYCGSHRYILTSHNHFWTIKLSCWVKWINYFLQNDIMIPYLICGNDISLAHFVPKMTWLFVLIFYVPDTYGQSYKSCVNSLNDQALWETVMADTKRWSGGTTSLHLNLRVSVLVQQGTYISLI